MRPLLLGLLMIFSLNLCAQELDCSKFKNGKFRIDSEFIGEMIIERKGNKQIEHLITIDKKSTFKVKWIDECTYTLKLKNQAKDQLGAEMPKDFYLIVEIIETKENSYVTSTTSNYSNVPVIIELFKID